MNSIFNAYTKWQGKFFTEIFMKHFLTITSIFIAITGVITSVILNDLLFAISFLWILIENIKNFPSNPNQDEEE